MKYTLRALLAISLLVGFYLVCVAVVFGLGWIAYRLTSWIASAGWAGAAGVLLGQLWILVAVVALAIARGVFLRKVSMRE